MLNVPETTERLARLVAAKTGTTPEAVIDEAVKDRARAVGVPLTGERLRYLSPNAIAARKARLRRAAGEIADLPLLDTRSPVEIMDELNAL